MERNRSWKLASRHRARRSRRGGGAGGHPRSRHLRRGEGAGRSTVAHAGRAGRRHRQRRRRQERLARLRRHRRAAQAVGGLDPRREGRRAGPARIAGRAAAQPVQGHALRALQPLRRRRGRRQPVRRRQAGGRGLRLRDRPARLRCHQQPRGGRCRRHQGALLRRARAEGHRQGHRSKDRPRGDQGGGQGSAGGTLGRRRQGAARRVGDSRWATRMASITR